MSHAARFDIFEATVRKAFSTTPFGALAAVAVVPGSVRIVLLGEASPGRPVAPQTPFHICSCTKMFTALLLADLVAEGGIRWDEPIARLVPEFRLPHLAEGETCTLRDLATMATGLARDGIAEWGFRQDAPKAERLARVFYMPTVAPFREGFSYSNLCYIALGLAAERLTGRSLDSLMRERIFRPLAMDDSFSAGVEGVRGAPALPYLPIGGAATAVEDLTGANSEGSARVHLSARDAAAWLHFLLAASSGGTGSLAAAARAIMEPSTAIAAPDPRQAPEGDPCAYGMGLFVTGFAGRRLLHHGGGGRGWRHSLALLPDAGAAVMLMASAETPMIDGLALDLLERLTGGHERDWAGRFSQAADASAAKVREAAEARFAQAGAPAEPIDACLGEYSNPLTGRVRLARDGETLRFLPEDAPIFAGSLRPIGGAVYEIAFDAPALTPQPLDPPFRVRVGRETMDAGYFGELRRCA